MIIFHSLSSKHKIALYTLCIFIMTNLYSSSEPFSSTPSPKAPCQNQTKKIIIPSNDIAHTPISADSWYRHDPYSPNERQKNVTTKES